MLQFRLDPTGPYALHFPRAHQRADILALAQRFVAYDEQLPLEQQSPFTPKLKTLLAQLLPSHAQSWQAERQRTQASESLKRIERAADIIIDQIIAMMRAVFPTRPEEAERWGLPVKQSTGRILKPRKREARLALLSAYIKTEQARPEAERFVAPVLAEVIRVRAGLQANLTARRAGQTQRETSNAAAKALSHELLNHLQVAAAYLVADRFDYQLGPVLENWGYTIVAARRGRNGRENGNDQAMGE